MIQLNLALTPLREPTFVLKQVARLTVAIASRLPPSDYRRRARSLAVVLDPVMTFMWLASSLFAHGMMATPLAHWDVDVEVGNLPS